MQEILVTSECPQVFINPPLAVIVTEPKDIAVAHSFGCDIVQMFGSTQEQAVEAAHKISEASDRLVVVIGAPNVDSARP